MLGRVVVCLGGVLNYSVRRFDLGLDVEKVGDVVLGWVVD